MSAGREPLLGGARGSPLAPPGASLRRAREWWRLTTDRTWLASPLSRRAFWRFYPYPMIVFTIIWLLLLCFGGVDASTLGPSFAETMVCLTVISIISRWLPRASLASDFFLVTAWTPVWWRNCRSLPVHAVVGFPSSPFLIFMMWAIGLHSLFVGQFALTTCFLIAADPRQMGAVSRALLIWILILIMPMIILLEWQSVFHFNKLQKHMSVSTDGQMVVNRNNGIIVSVCTGTTELLGLNLAGAPFRRVVGEDDWARVQRWCKDSTGQHAEALLVTLCSRASSESQPTQEFDARLILYEVTGSDMHFCLQVVGEMRSSDVAGGAAWRRYVSSESRPVREQEDDACSFAVTSVENCGGAPRSPKAHPRLGGDLRLPEEDRSCALTLSSASTCSRASPSMAARQVGRPRRTERAEAATQADLPWGPRAAPAEERGDTAACGPLGEPPSEPPGEPPDAPRGARPLRRPGAACEAEGDASPPPAGQRPAADPAGAPAGDARATPPRAASTDSWAPAPRSVSKLSL